MKVETHCILFLRLSAQKLLREIRLNFKLQIVFLQDIVQIKKNCIVKIQNHHSEQAFALFIYSSFNVYPM